MSALPQSPTSRYPGTVAVFYTCHLAVDQREWRIMNEFGWPYRPVLGEYRSNDPKVLRQHLQWMRRAGIDLIVYNAFATDKMTLLDFPRDPTLPLLIEELSRQDDEPRKLQLCFWLENYLGNPTVEMYDFALDYIRQHFAPLPCYYRYEGRPLVLTYLNGENRAINDVECRNTFFSLRRVRPYYTDVWSYVDNYPQLPRKDWMPASPGIDPYLEMAYVAKYVRKDQPLDLEKVRKDFPKTDRENGAYYRKQLGRAKQVNPQIIFLSGWNDWQYGLQIEPAVEYGCQYLDLTAEVLGRQQETEPYREVE